MRGGNSSQLGKAPMRPPVWSESQSIKLSANFVPGGAVTCLPTPQTLHELSGVTIKGPGGCVAVSIVSSLLGAKKASSSSSVVGSSRKGPGVGEIVGDGVSIVPS